MEGVTDAPMRALLTELGGFTHSVGEFLRVSHEVPPSRTFLLHLPELAAGAVTPSGVPIQVQLLGGNPEKMAQSALVACGLGAQSIDINFGCPAPTVNRHDGGATLLKFPDRIRQIVRSVRELVPQAIPVSAKLRLGWDQMDSIHLNAERAAEGGADWITIHGRTRMQGYSPPAYWGPIGEVRRSLNIPVVANGDIWTLEDFFRCQDATGCEHFMLGRGALADPSLALRVAKAMGRSVLASPILTEGYPTLRQPWIGLLRRFVEYNLQYGKPNRTEVQILSRIKQWLKMAYLRSELLGQPFEWFDSIKRVQNLEAMFAVLGR
jgi:tRNA-dihydrouridine synthase C